MNQKLQTMAMKEAASFPIESNLVIIMFNRLK